MAHTTTRSSILLVDDDQIILDTLSFGLGKANYIVRQCTTAGDAVAEYTASTPDLAILDIGLPDMRGTELAEVLLEHRYRPILILSSHSESDWVDQAIGSGVIGYLVKPLTVEQLIPSIETALARFGDINRRIAVNFGNANMSETQLLAAMDQFSFGMLIIDMGYQIIHCNRAGQKLLAKGNPLSSAHGKLRTSNNNGELRAVLDQGLGKGNDSATPAAMSLLDPRSNTAIQIWVKPLPVVGDSAEQTAMLIINDTSLNVIAPSCLLKSLYGFTEKESKLAHSLASGLTINEYCKIAFVTPNTVRTHLKSIYRKTSTNRQTELVRLLSSLFINLPNPDE
jgi:DNA-binding NarL/FixJ family response regulator